jgi:hypothetical protein
MFLHRSQSLSHTPLPGAYPPRATRISSTPSKSQFTRTTLKYHSQISVCPSVSNTDIFQLNSFMNFILSLICAPCHVHAILLNLNTLITSG